MMKHEFEALAGYEVTREDYDKIIEPMYMATDLNKEEFVKCIDRKRFALKTKAELKRAMRKEANRLYEICNHCHDFESEERLEKLAREYATRFFGYDARLTRGVGYYIRREYQYPGMRGCSYPADLIILSGENVQIEDVVLYA